MSDLNGSIEDHKTGDYTVTRKTGGSWSEDGRYTPGAESTLLISASVQPAGAELTDLPEGQSVDDVKVIYTETRLYGRKPGTPQVDPEDDDVGRIDPDIVSIDDEDYRVFKVAKWDHWGETHFVAYAAKIAP